MRQFPGGTNTGEPCRVLTHPTDGKAKPPLHYNSFARLSQGGGCAGAAKMWGVSRVAIGTDD